MTGNLPQDNNQSRPSDVGVGSQGSLAVTPGSQDKPVTDQPTADQTSSKQTYPPLPTEQREAVGSLYKEAGPTGIVEQKEFETPKEVKEYVTKVKKEDSIDLPVPIEDEYGQVLMESARSSKPKIVLPLGDQGIKSGIKQSVTNSVRWLVTWCLRLIKMFPKRVVYKKKRLASSD